MKSFLTEDFFKNVIGFATILMVGIGITAFAGGKSHTEEPTAPTTQTAATR